MSSELSCPITNQQMITLLVLFIESVIIVTYNFSISRNWTRKLNVWSPQWIDVRTVGLDSLIQMLFLTCIFNPKWESNESSTRRNFLSPIMTEVLIDHNLLLKIAVLTFVRFGFVFKVLGEQSCYISDREIVELSCNKI